MRGTILPSAIALVLLAGTVAAAPPTRPQQPTPTPMTTNRMTARTTQQTAIVMSPCGAESAASASFRPSSSEAEPPAATGKQAAGKKDPTQLDVTHLTGSLGQTMSVNAKLTVKPQGKAVPNHTVHFWLDAAYLGSAKTNAQGRAEIQYKVEEMKPHRIKARYYGSDLCFASRGENDLEMRKASAKITLRDPSRMDKGPATSVQVGREFLLSGTLARINDNKAIDGREVVISFDGAPLPPLATSSSGGFSWKWTPPSGTEGNHGIVVRFAGDSLYTAASASHVLTVASPPRPAWLKIKPVAGMVGETKVVTATLFSTEDETWRPGIGIPGVKVRVWWASGDYRNETTKDLGSAVTDATGTARITFKIGEEPGTYELRGWAGGVGGVPGWDLDLPARLYYGYKVEKSPVTIAVTGPASARIGDTILVAAVLKRVSDGAPLAGMKVSVPGISGGATKTTMNNGAVPFNLTIGSGGGTGPQPITAKFDGTSRYLAGSGSMTINVLPKTN